MRNRLRRRKQRVIYRLEDRPPLPQTPLPLVSICSAILCRGITPAPVICGRWVLPAAQDTQHIIQHVAVRGVASVYSNQSVMGMAR